MSCYICEKVNALIYCLRAIIMICDGIYIPVGYLGNMLFSLASTPLCPPMPPYIIFIAVPVQYCTDVRTIPVLLLQIERHETDQSLSYIVLQPVNS